MEWIIYITFPIILFSTIYFMLNFYSVTYSLKKDIAKNNVTIKEMKNDNEEQRVLINDLSSYERIKEIAKVLGMEANKDNVKVVR
nr:septum formation initiator family protein [Gemella palaticanis]